MSLIPIRPTKMSEVTVILLLVFLWSTDATGDNEDGEEDNDDDDNVTDSDAPWFELVSLSLWRRCGAAGKINVSFDGTKLTMKCVEEPSWRHAANNL